MKDLWEEMCFIRMMAAVGCIHHVLISWGFGTAGPQLEGGGEGVWLQHRDVDLKRKMKTLTI